MASKAQISANRANAKRSTGPKTPAGKRKASMNALQHGLTCSRDIVTWDEDPRELERLRKGLEEVYPPDNALVRELVDQLAGLLWRSRRPAKLEAAKLGHRLQDTFIEVFQMLDPETRKKVLDHLRELLQARRQNEGGKIGFFADLGQALSREIPEVMAGVLEAEKARDIEHELAAIARHETSLRNGITRTLATLHALGAARSEQR